MPVHHFRVVVHLPPHLSPDPVIAAVHDHTNLMKSQGLVKDFKPVPTEPHVTTLPIFHPHHPAPVKTFEFTEGVVIMPGIGDWGKRSITIPAHFQDFDTGTRSTALAPGGVQVRATWMVRKEVNEDRFGESWALVEEAEVECSGWLMWFVKRSMEGAHRDICKKLLERVEEDQKAHELEG